MNGKTKNPVVAKSVRLDASAGVQYMLESQRNRSKAGEEHVLARPGQAGREQHLPLSMSIRLLAEDVAHIRGASSPLKIQFKSMCVPTSKIQTRSEFSHFKPS